MRYSRLLTALRGVGSGRATQCFSRRGGESFSVDYEHASGLPDGRGRGRVAGMKNNVVFLQERSEDLYN